MSGYDSLRTRLVYAAGGHEPTQENINTQNKLRSMQSSLTNSEQMEHVSIGIVDEGEFEYSDKIDVLINPDKLAFTYDQKEISIDPTKHSLEEGNIVRWYRNAEYNWWHKDYSDWLVIMRDLEEKAYIRARIRKCNYFVDVNGHQYEIALTGPQETDVVWDSKHKIETNDMNYKPYFYVTKDEITNDFFKRFQKMRIDGHTWRAAVVDRMTSEGVIKVSLEEYFDNNMEDEIIEIEPVIPDKKEPHIEGPQTVRPYDSNLIYKVVDAAGGEFVAETKKIKIENKDDGSCIVTVLTGKSGEINLIYRIEGQDDIILPIVIKSL